MALINNLYDDTESHNSKAVSEIYLSTGYFHSFVPIGNGSVQKDGWTTRESPSDQAAAQSAH